MYCLQLGSISREADAVSEAIIILPVRDCRHCRTVEAVCMRKNLGRHSHRPGTDQSGSYTSLAALLGFFHRVSVLTGTPMLRLEDASQNPIAGKGNTMSSGLVHFT